MLFAIWELHAGVVAAESVGSLAKIVLASLPELAVDSGLQVEAPGAEEGCKDEEDDALLEGAADAAIVFLLLAGAVASDSSQEDEGPHQEGDKSSAGDQTADSALLQHLSINGVRSILLAEIEIFTFTALTLVSGLEGSRGQVNMGVIVLLVNIECIVVLEFATVRGRATRRSARIHHLGTVTFATNLTGKLVSSMATSLVRTVMVTTAAMVLQHLANVHWEE